MNKTATNGLCEWEETEIKMFLQEITRYTLPLQNRMESILKKNEHKKMIDLLVFYQFYEHIGRINLNCTVHNWNAFKQLVNDKKIKVSLNQSDFFQPQEQPVVKTEKKQEITEQSTQQNQQSQLQQNTQTNQQIQNDQTKTTQQNQNAENTQNVQQTVQTIALDANVEFRITQNFRILICHFIQHNDTDYTFTMSYNQLANNFSTAVEVINQLSEESEKQTINFYRQLFETCLKIDSPNQNDLFFNFVCQNGKLVTNYFVRPQ